MQFGKSSADLHHRPIKVEGDIAAQWRRFSIDLVAAQTEQALWISIVGFEAEWWKRGHSTFCSLANLAGESPASAIVHSAE